MPAGIRKGCRVTQVCFRDADVAEADRIAQALRDEGWPCNRSLVVREAMRCLSDALRGKSPEEMLRYFIEHRRRRGQRPVSPPAAA